MGLFIECGILYKEICLQLLPYTEGKSLLPPPPGKRERTQRNHLQNVESYKKKKKKGHQHFFFPGVKFIEHLDMLICPLTARIGSNNLDRKGIKKSLESKDIPSIF